MENKIQEKQIKKQLPNDKDISQFIQMYTQLQLIQSTLSPYPLLTYEAIHHQQQYLYKLNSLISISNINQDSQLQQLLPQKSLMIQKQQKLVIQQKEAVMQEKQVDLIVPQTNKLNSKNKLSHYFYSAKDQQIKNSCWSCK